MLGNRGENIASIPVQLLEGATVLVQSLGQRWGEIVHLLWVIQCNLCQ